MKTVVAFGRLCAEVETGFTGNEDAGETPALPVDSRLRGKHHGIARPHKGMKKAVASHGTGVGAGFKRPDTAALSIFIAKTGWGTLRSIS